MAKAMQPQKLHFSQAMQTEKYKNLINNTLGDPVRAARFAANITSAVAVMKRRVQHYMDAMVILH